MQRFWFGPSLFCLLVVLVACNGPSTPSTGANPSSSPHASSSSPTSASSTKVYTGTHFRLTYPANWLAQGSGDQLIFQDAQGLNALTVIISANPGGHKSASNLADTLFPVVEKAVLTNPQPANTAPSVMIAGDNWIQRGATGTFSTNGQSGPGTLILLVTNHPGNSSQTRTYEIYYGGPAATFEHINQTIFQEMLRSFAFQP